MTDCETIFKNKLLYLLIDDTLINKWYSRVREGACDNFDTSDRKTYRSLCSVVVMITDGTIAIPIDQALWISLEYNPVNYAKKWEIAQKLISRIRPYIRIKKVVMNGLYAIPEFMVWLIQHKFDFEMRFHSHRVAERHKLKLDNVEVTIKSLKRLNLDQLNQRFKRPEQIIGGA